LQIHSQEIKKNEILNDENGNPTLRHGDEEIRFEQDPFPLYPGEKLVGKVSPLQVVASNTALRLKCLRDFEDEKVKRVAGDEWLFIGPGTYKPRIEVTVVRVDKVTVIKKNSALKLRALKECVDVDGKKRTTGEEWLIRKVGAYLPQVDEEVVETLNAYVLTDRKALHLRATQTFTDAHKKIRKAGEEWLVTNLDAETHIPDVYEQVVGEVKINTLTNLQFAVVLDPWNKEGKPQLGQKELRKGPLSFFLQPGERLENGIQNVYILEEDECLLLQAKEGFLDGKEERKAGDTWTVNGPAEFVPPTSVEIIERRRAIPLDESEGIYIRDIRTGRVSTISAQSYMLKPNEELWKKDLPKIVEEVLAKDTGSTTERDKTRLVTYKAPHNCAIQIYDYKEKKARVVFGPELCKLGPDEQFTVISLSGDQPKRPDVSKVIAVRLGPDFMTDIVIVETADHARLSLKLSYNWHFEVDKSSIEDAEKIFQVPDFVGDCCKAVASRVRGAVASVSFDEFHKRSATIIQNAVFGASEENEPPKNRFHFSANNLVITNIDIQSVEPVDQRTRDSLQKSVQLAIEITTKSQESTAKHENYRLEQEAIGRLERQKLKDQAEAEKAKTILIMLQTESAALSTTGQAKAEAKAKAESTQIEGESNVVNSRLIVEASQIKLDCEQIWKEKKNKVALEFLKKKNELEIKKKKALAEIESKKFEEIVKVITREALQAMARAGPETQAKLLEGLGLKSFLITDGNSPINLFNTANGLIQNS